MTGAVALIDYGAGNLQSVRNALKAAGATDIRVTNDPQQVLSAERIVLPGVGAFAHCMSALSAIPGMVDALNEATGPGAKPFLGICVGMQLLYESSEESPGITGLGVLCGKVKRLPSGVKHPQMQWNRLDVVAESPLLDGLDERPWMYFVHSYAPELTGDVIATCDYGGPVTAAVQHEMVMATQFHPEKSGAVGLALLGNFVRLAASVPVD